LGRWEADCYAFKENNSAIKNFSKENRRKSWLIKGQIPGEQYLSRPLEEVLKKCIYPAPIKNL